VLWALTLKRGLILGTLISYTIALAVQAATVPTVDINLGTEAQVVHAAEETQEKLALAGAPAPTQVEAKVRDYFADIPVMAEVARCESTFRHIDSNTGSVLRGVVNSSDVGVMQINTYYHSKTATHLGLDLLDFEDNLAYARYLYEREGTQPWSASEPCWGSSLLAMR
jgi:hypothetical protein